MSELNLRQRLILRLFGRVFLRNELRDGWLRQIPVYAAHCQEHGDFEDYPHGWSSRLDTPVCRLNLLVSGLEVATVATVAQKTHNIESLRLVFQS